MTQLLRRIEDQYEILSKLSEGGMGEIYKVRHKLLDEIRVVKILRPQHEDDEEIAARFAHEAKAAIRLRHPNIVQLFDFTLDESGNGLMMMEFIEGIDLETLLSGPRPSIPLAIEIGRQTLGALAYLHRNDFVHRDISPDNIMLSRDFEDRPLVKLIDLGIAKQLDGQAPQLTASGAFLGKFRYASPEHFGVEGLAAVDRRSDIYSFGLVFYQLLTGRFPFAGSSTSQLIAAHLYGAPIDFSISDPEGRLGDDLRGLLLETLYKDPLQRLGSAGELIDRLDRLHEPSSEGLVAEVLELTRHNAQEPQALAPEDEETLEAAAADLPTPPESVDETAPAGESIPAEASAPAQESVSTRESPAPEKPASTAGLAPTVKSPVAEAPPPKAPELEPSPADAAEPASAVASFTTLIEGVQESLRQGDFDVAEELLAEAARQEDETLERASTLASLRREIVERREQATTEGSAAVAEIESLLTSGELLRADRALFQATERFGETPALSALRQRLDLLHHEELEADLRRLVTEAETLAENGRLAAAQDLVFKARSVAPEGAWTEKLEVLARSLDKKSREQRDDLIATTRERLTERIQALDYPGARKVLAAAETRLGSAPGGQTLKKYLVDIYLEGIHTRARRAAVAFGAGDYEEAVRLLQEALRLDSGNAWVRDRLSDAQERLALQQRQAPAEVELAADLTAVEDAAGRGDLPGARQLLQEAEKRWQGSSRFGALRESLEARIADELRLLLERARKAHGDHDDLKARLLAARALEIAPEHTEARSLIDELDRDQDESPNAAELAPTVAEIRQHMSDDEPLEAWKVLKIAIEHFGEQEILRSLQRQIADRLLDDDA